MNPETLHKISYGLYKGIMKKEHELHELPNNTNGEKIIYKELSYKIMQAVF